AGLKKYLPPEELQGRKAVFVYNMKPTKLRGEMSEGMILAADEDEGKKVVPLFVEKTLAGEEVVFEGTDNSPAEVSFDEFMKLKISVKGERVFCNGKKLKSKVEEVLVKVKDGGMVR
ncbi:MAG: hypothetical protein AABY26_06070, partial [Nanoarchaeota archaeon]